MLVEEKIENIIISFQHFLFNENKDNLYPFDDLKIINNRSINNKIGLLNADISFIGHEHKSFEVNRDNKKIIDVGSSGCLKNENTFYTILTVDNKKIDIEKKYLIYNRAEFEKNFKNIKYPEKEIINKIFFGINIYKKEVNNDE